METRPPGWLSRRALFPPRAACDSEGLEGDNIHQISGWDSVLGDENGRPVFHQFGKNSGGLALQSCNQLSLHRSNTNYSTVLPFAIQTLTSSSDFTQIFVG